MGSNQPLLVKTIACEIAFRELSHCAAQSKNLVEFEFLNQGYHDTPSQGRDELQRRLNAVPPGKYDAILLGYGLCSNILSGLSASHTRVIVPRAHDCITFFLGSKEAYAESFANSSGTYYYTSGWLECAQRRGLKEVLWGGPSQSSASSPTTSETYNEWVRKHGQEQADFLLTEMGRWAASYTHGNLIQFSFLKHLKLEIQVQKICSEKGWSYVLSQGKLDLMQALLDGPWSDDDFLTVLPGQRIAPSFDETIIKAEPAA